MSEEKKDFVIGGICWVLWERWTNFSEIVQGVIIDSQSSEWGVKTAFGKRYYGTNQMYHSEAQAKSMIQEMALNLEMALEKASLAIAEYNRLALEQNKPTLNAGFSHNHFWYPNLFR